MNEHQLWLADESATIAFGQALGAALAAVPALTTLFLQGDLGAGKTTLTRGILQSFGHTGRVKSPTYTLVEEYKLPQRTLYHFDLYRLGDPEELEYMGIRDYFCETSVCILEWPERGEAVLPDPDIILTLTVQDGGRLVKLGAGSDVGHQILLKLNE